MKLIKTNSQKDYLTKFCQDLSKAILIIMVIAPLVKTGINPIVNYLIGSWSALIFFIVGYLLESREVE